MQSINKHISKDLLKLTGIAWNLRDVSIKIFAELDLFHHELMFNKRQSLQQDLINIGILELYLI